MRPWGWSAPRQGGPCCGLGWSLNRAGAPGAGQVGGWLAAWLLYQAVVRLVLPLVGKSKDRRQVLRTAVQALTLFAWTAVAVWA